MDKHFLKRNQNELRKLMNEKKSARAESSSRVQHPLAKYSDGQLNCMLCKSIVKSEAVWSVHLNTKKHRENVQIAKQLKEKLEKAPQSITGLKRPIEVVHSEVVPSKKLKGILKNSTTSEIPPENGQQQELPDDFFDNAKTNNKPVEKSSPEKMEVEEEEEKLPEGFFDDPVKDAKAHNKEYKDPNDEEWEKFQKEIKEATTKSMAIINEEIEEATVERQIDEIDEQIRNWSRVLDLEKKKEIVHQAHKIKKEPIIKKELKNSDDELEDEDNFDEFLDWRAKKSHK